VVLIQLAVRVAAGVDFAQGIDVDVGVDSRRFHAFVAEHFLHIPDVGTAAMHVRGESWLITLAIV
jgi:hypothetical protein